MLACDAGTTAHWYARDLKIRAGMLAGDRKFPASQDLPDFGYAAFAQSLGLGGFRLDHSDHIVVAIEQALAADRPYVLEVISDPNVPPLPPHVSAKQVRNYLVALAKGNSDAINVVRASLKQIFA